MAEPMQAGRELDAVVAERVMGRRATMLPTSLSEADPHVVDYSISRGFSRCPSYSTSIAAAWEVVEKLRAEGRRLNLFQDDRRRWGPNPYTKMIHLPGEAEHEHDVWLCIFDDGSGGVNSMAESAPHAICLAALAALASVPPAPAGTEEGA